MEALKILYIEDSSGDAELVLRSLQKDGFRFNPRVVESLESLQAALSEKRWDLVLSDSHLPSTRVEEALACIRVSDPDLPLIVVSGAIEDEQAEQLRKSGARDFIDKSDLSRLAPVMRRELQQAGDRRSRGERALQESEERFLLAMRGASDGLWDWNLETDEVYYSPQWKQMLGYRDSDVENLMSSWERLLHPEDREWVMQRTTDYIEGRTEHFEAEYRMLHRKGFYVDILSRAFAVLENQKPRRLVGTHVDISARKQAELALRSSESQLRGLSAHLQRVREEEKAHIAREVHDELGATLTALNMDMHWIESRLPQERPELKAKIADMSHLVDAAVEACNRIVTELRPSVLDDLGLLAAMEWQAKGFSARYDISCKVSTNIAELVLDDEQAIAVFRILQEALTNIARHAHATAVEVILLRRDDLLQLQVADDGIGLPVQHGGTIESCSRSPHFQERRAEPRRTSAFSPGSYGIRGMGERAASLNGRLHLESHPGIGTRVILRLPLTPSGHSRATTGEQTCTEF